MVKGFSTERLNTSSACQATGRAECGFDLNRLRLCKAGTGGAQKL